MSRKATGSVFLGIGVPPIFFFSYYLMLPPTTIKTSWWQIKNVSEILVHVLCTSYPSWPFCRIYSVWSGIFFYEGPVDTRRPFRNSSASSPLYRHDLKLRVRLVGLGVVPFFNFSLKRWAQPPLILSMTNANFRSPGQWNLFQLFLWVVEETVKFMTLYRNVNSIPYRGVPWERIE